MNRVVEKATLRKCRYIHILWKDELLFGPRWIALLSNPKNGFDLKDHLFVVSSQRVFDAACRYDRVILDQGSNKGRLCVDLINKYAPLCDWVFVHSLPAVPEVFHIKRANRKKVVWRTWGHDATLPYSYYPEQYMRNWIKGIVERLWIKEIQSFAAVGTANLIDTISIEERFGDLNMFPLPYPVPGRYEMLNRIRDDGIDRRDGTINIMVGHSGYENDNHNWILKKLEKYKKERICIYLVLAYGDSQYIQSVREYAQEHWSEKIVIIENGMAYASYMRLLSRMDAAIFDGLNSYALGNIGALLFFNKKIIINRAGIIRKAFDILRIPYMCTDSAFDLSFDDFVRPIEYDKNVAKDLMPKKYDEDVADVKRLLAWLDMNVSNLEPQRKK